MHRGGSFALSSVMIGGLATVAHFDAAWLYPFSTWASWLGPLLVFEAGQFLDRPKRQPRRSRAA